MHCQRASHLFILSHNQQGKEVTAKDSGGEKEKKKFKERNEILEMF